MRTFFKPWFIVFGPGSRLMRELLPSDHFFLVRVLLLKIPDPHIPQSETVDIRVLFNCFAYGSTCAVSGFGFDSYKYGIGSCLFCLEMRGKFE